MSAAVFKFRTKVWKGYPYFAMGHNWCAKCLDCGEVLTKFAFSKEEAEREAEGHRCP